MYTHHKLKNTATRCVAVPAAPTVGAHCCCHFRIAFSTDAAAAAAAAATIAVVVSTAAAAIVAHSALVVLLATAAAAANEITATASQTPLCCCCYACTASVESSADSSLTSSTGVAPLDKRLSTAGGTGKERTVSSFRFPATGDGATSGSGTM
jgi:hypothetical protein